MNNLFDILPENFFNIFYNFIVYILIICYTLSKRDVSCNVLLNVPLNVSLNASLNASLNLPLNVPLNASFKISLNASLYRGNQLWRILLIKNWHSRL